MPISYKPLWKLLIDKNMGKVALSEAASFSRSTLAKMSKDEYVALEVIERICLTLGCQPSDIITVFSKE